MLFLCRFTAGHPWGWQCLGCSVGEARADTATAEVSGFSTAAGVACSAPAQVLTHSVGACKKSSCLPREIKVQPNLTTCSSSDLGVCPPEPLHVGSGVRRGPTHRASTYVKLANAQPPIPAVPSPSLTVIPSSSPQAMSTGHSPQKRKR